MIDAHTLLSLGAQCRRASLTFATQAYQLGRAARDAGRAEPDEAIEAAYRATDLERAAQYLQAEAQDTEMLAILRHRDAGGRIVLEPITVVVGDHQETAIPANDAAGPHLFGRLRRLISGRA